MAKRLLGKQELEDISWGSTLLGSGGGGSLYDGLRQIADIEKKVTLLEPADLPEDANAVVVAGIGAQTMITKTRSGPEAIFAYEMMKNLTSIGGVKIDYVMPVEIGGCNILTPFYVASKKNIAVVDADGNGRSIPEIATTLLSIYQISHSPMVVANKIGDITVVYLADPYDTKTAETIARNVTISFGSAAAISFCVVSIATIIKCLVPNSISKAETIGKTIREARANGKNTVIEVLAITGGKVLFRGRISKIEVKTAEGFDFGRTTIEGSNDYKGKTFVIDSKNENMIAWQNGKPVAMVPDLIAMMTVKGEPLSNIDIKEGMEIIVLGIPAPEPWMRTPNGFNCFGHILEKLGYKGSYVGLF